MAFNRLEVAATLPGGDELTRAMAGIGMNFAVAPLENPNIEDTLLAASREAMENDDLRVLSITVKWLEIHHPRLNVDRLYRAVSRETSLRVRAFWTAVAQWLRHDRRLTRLARLHGGPRIDLLRIESEYYLRHRGEDPRFAGTVLRLPAGFLRDRPGDVLSERELARQHETYRERIRSGPSYRADMWALVVREPAMPAADLARRTYGSFATAWQVKRDHGLLTG